MSLITETIRRTCNPNVRPIDDQLTTGQCPSSPRQSDENAVHRFTICGPPMSLFTETIRRSWSPNLTPVDDQLATGQCPPSPRQSDDHAAHRSTICGPQMLLITETIRGTCSPPVHDYSPQYTRCCLRSCNKRMSVQQPWKVTDT